MQNAGEIPFPRYENPGGIEVQLHSFLISALHLGEWLTSRPVRFTPGNYLGIHWIGADLEVLKERKVLCPYRESKPAPFKHSQLLSSLT